MCDPVSLSIMSTVVGAAGTAANAFGAMNAQKKQKQMVDQWAMRQDAMRANEKVRQDTLRQQAEAAQQEGLKQTSADAQKQAQTAEEARLAQYMQGQGKDDPSRSPAEAAAISASDQAIAAGATSGDPQKTDLAKKINEATTSAKQRIKALATVSSYGGSEGGLGTIVPQAFARSGAGIDTANDFRRGSLAAYSTERAVDPVQVSYTGSPLAQIFSDVASIGAQGIGSSLGKGMFGAFPAAPTAKPFIGPTRAVPAYLNPDYGHLF